MQLHGVAAMTGTAVKPTRTCSQLHGSSLSVKVDISATAARSCLLLQPVERYSKVLLMVLLFKLCQCSQADGKNLKSNHNSCSGD